MSTLIRPVISKKNLYYIPKHRYYELKHFCLQYRDWKRIYNDLCEKIPSENFDKMFSSQIDISEMNLKRQKYLDKIILVEESALLADKDIGDYILLAVTEDKSFKWLVMNKHIPCCKDIYYDRYRRFFYILSHKKDA